MRKSAVLALLLLLSIGFARANEIRPGDVVRAIALPSGTLYLQAEGTSREQSVTAVILRDATHTIVLQPFECLPADVRPASGRGQVFGGAELESGELLLPIGWSNPSGRNINGIAVLDGSTYDCKRVIILPGSVRDIAPLSGNLVAVVLTRLTREGNELAIAVIETSGGIRGWLHLRSDEVDQIEKEALDCRVHRIDGDRFAVAMLNRSLMFRYELHRGVGACNPRVKTYRDDGLVYPVFGSYCDEIIVKQWNAVGSKPTSMDNMSGIRVIDASYRPNGSEVAVWSGYDSKGPKTFVTIYGEPKLFGDGSGTIEIPERLLPNTIAIEHKAIHGLVQVGEKFEEKTISLP